MRLLIVAGVLAALGVGAFVWLNWATTYEYKYVVQQSSSSEWIATVTESRAKGSNSVTATTLAVRRNTLWAKPQDILGVLNARPIRMQWVDAHTLVVECQNCDVFLRYAAPPDVHVTLNITDPVGRDISN